MINRKCRKKGVETLIQQVQTTAANPVESEQIDLPEVVLQPLPMNAKVAEQHHFAHGLLEEMLFKRGIFKPYFMGEGKHGKPFLLDIRKFSLISATAKMRCSVALARNR